MKCKKHPRYRAIKKPTSKCWHCIRIYNKKQRQDAENRVLAFAAKWNY